MAKAVEQRSEEARKFGLMWSLSLIIEIIDSRAASKCSMLFSSFFNSLEMSLSESKAV
jgi:hypothetical protein